MKPHVIALMLFAVGCGNANTAILPTSDAAKRAAEAPPASVLKATLPLPNKPGK